jgi:hypothetical protein
MIVSRPVIATASAFPSERPTVTAIAPVWGRWTWVDGAVDLAKTAFLTISNGLRLGHSVSKSASGNARSNWFGGRSLENIARHLEK